MKLKPKSLELTYLTDNIPLPIDIKSALVFENQAQFHPRKFLIPLAEKIHNNGVKSEKLSNRTE